MLSLNNTTTWLNFFEVIISTKNTLYKLFHWEILYPVLMWLQDYVNYTVDISFKYFLYKQATQISVFSMQMYKNLNQPLQPFSSKNSQSLSMLNSYFQECRAKSYSAVGTIHLRFGTCCHCQDFPSQLFHSLLQWKLFEMRTEAASAGQRYTTHASLGSCGLTSISISQ